MFGPFEDEKTMASTSRSIAYVLRHRPYEAGIELDEHGWCEVWQLMDKLPNVGHSLTREQLDYIVANDDKGRYVYNDDSTLIRAAQGHSFPVDVELPETQPPDVLWHGTAEKSVASIEASGLSKMSRLYVHLSADRDTAVDVGSRHGSPVVYEVDAKGMHEDGYPFYLSENGVWLTDNVPARYLTRLS